LSKLSGIGGAGGGARNFDDDFAAVGFPFVAGAVGASAVDVAAAAAVAAVEVGGK